MASPTITIRLSVAEVERMRGYVNERKAQPRNEEYTFSDFCRQAIQEKLDHLDRSKRLRAKTVSVREIDCPHCLVVNNERVALINGRCSVCGGGEVRP